MPEHILFLTGRLANRSLHRVLEGMATRSFTYEIRELGLQVAGLMTTAMIARRLEPPRGFTRILVPGLCNGSLEELSERLGGAGRARPEGPQGPARVLRHPRHSTRSQPLLGQDICRDRRRAPAHGRGDLRARRRLPCRRRRRHRSRLPTRSLISASRGRHRRTALEGSSGQC